MFFDDDGIPMGRQQAKRRLAEKHKQNTHAAYEKFLELVDEVSPNDSAIPVPAGEDAERQRFLRDRRRRQHAFSMLAKCTLSVAYHPTMILAGVINALLNGLLEFQKCFSNTEQGDTATVTPSVAVSCMQGLGNMATSTAGIEAIAEHPDMSGAVIRLCQLPQIVKRYLDSVTTLMLDALGVVVRISNTAERKARAVTEGAIGAAILCLTDRSLSSPLRNMSSVLIELCVRSLSSHCEQFQFSEKLCSRIEFNAESASFRCSPSLCKECTRAARVLATYLTSDSACGDDDGGSSACGLDASLKILAESSCHDPAIVARLLQTIVNVAQYGETCREQIAIRGGAATILAALQCEWVRCFDDGDAEELEAAVVATQADQERCLNWQRLVAELLLRLCRDSGAAREACLRDVRAALLTLATMLDAESTETQNSAFELLQHVVGRERTLAVRTTENENWREKSRALLIRPGTVATTEQPAAAERRLVEIDEGTNKVSTAVRDFVFDYIDTGGLERLMIMAKVDRKRERRRNGRKLLKLMGIPGASPSSPDTPSLSGLVSASAVATTTTIASLTHLCECTLASQVHVGNSVFLLGLADEVGANRLRAVCSHHLWLLPSEEASAVMASSAARALRRKDAGLWDGLVLPLLGCRDEVGDRRREKEAGDQALRNYIIKRALTPTKKRPKGFS